MQLFFENTTNRDYCLYFINIDCIKLNIFLNLAPQFEQKF